MHNYRQTSIHVHVYALVLFQLTITKTPFSKTLRLLVNKTTCTIPCTQEAFSARFHGKFS